MKEEIYLMLIGFVVVSFVSVLIHIALKLIHIGRWAISFPLASLICYCVFCMWFVGRPFPLHLEGHDFGIVSFLGGPITYIIPFFPDWLDFHLINLILPLLIAFQYLLIGWLIDRIVKKVNKTKVVK